MDAGRIPLSLLKAVALAGAGPRPGRGVPAREGVRLALVWLDEPGRDGSRGRSDLFRGGARGLGRFAPGRAGGVFGTGGRRAPAGRWIRGMGHPGVPAGRGPKPRPVSSETGGVGQDGVVRVGTQPSYGKENPDRKPPLSLMDMSTPDKKLSVSDAGHRREGGGQGIDPVLPAPLSSSSNDGRTAAWTPGAAGDDMPGQHVGGEGGDPPAVIETAGPSSAARQNIAATKQVVVAVERIEVTRSSRKTPRTSEATALRGQPLSVFRFGGGNPGGGSESFRFAPRGSLPDAPHLPSRGGRKSGRTGGSGTAVVVVSDSSVSPDVGGQSSPVDVVGVTAESGATKRSKRGGNVAPRKRKVVRRRRWSDDTDDPASSTGEGGSVPPPSETRGEEDGTTEPLPNENEERGDTTSPPASAAEEPPSQGGRGGPPTTGKGLLILQRKEALKKVENLKKEVKTLEGIASGDYSPTRGSRQLARLKKDLSQSLPDRPVRDIAAEATEAARKIDALAAKCSNVKGGFVSQFRRNALFLEMAMDAVLTRGHASGLTQEEGELERLRERNRALEEEVALLQKEKEGRRQMPPPPPPSPTPRSTGGGGGREKKKREARGELDGMASLEREEFPPLTLDEPPPCLPSTSRMDAEDYSDYLSEGPPRRAVPPAPKSAAAVLSVKKGEKHGGQKGKGAKPAVSSQQPASPSTLDREEVRAMVEEAVGKAMSGLQQQLEALMRRFASLPSGNGARSSAPKAAPTKGSAAGRPVPETGGEKRKKKKKAKKRKNGGSDPSPPQKIPKAPPLPSGMKRSSKGEAVKPPAKGAVPGRGERKWEPAPGPSRSEGTTWVQVLGRKEKRRAAQAAKPPPPPQPKGQQKRGPPHKAPQQQKLQGGAKGKKAPRRRVPNTSAVVLTCPKGTYAKTMAEVRAKIPLSEVGIKGGLTTRTAATGAIVLEVSDPTHSAKADALAARMREVLACMEGVRVDRPVKMAEVRVGGLEASITEGEVVAAVAEKAGCRPDDVQPGVIRSGPGGQGSLWLRLPLAAAKKAVLGTDGIVVGWSRVRISLLDARPMRCHRCLELGHARERCPSTVDRSQRCFRCAALGHLSRDCRGPPKCPLCMDTKRPAGHALGAQQCSQRKVRGTVGGEKGGGTTPRTPSQPAVKERSEGTGSKPAPLPPSGPVAGGSNEAPLPQRTLRPKKGKGGAADGSLSPTSSPSGDEMEAEPLGN